MREILFRGKRKSNGEWIFGNLLQTDDDGICIIQNHVPHHLLKEYEVDPKTVCQYTGLTAKDGKKIFEGDIVECRARKDGHDKYKVVWCKDYADFRIEPLDFGVQFPIADYEGEYIRGGKYSVIGNIFDNPELIGEQP